MTAGSQPGGQGGGRREPRLPRDRGDLAALVLAGGFSARMEEFKPLLPFAGATVLERAVDTFLEAGVAEVSVVIGHRGDELLPVLDRLEVRSVVNPAFDQGMFSSVVAGVRALPAGVGACFVLPADMPAVRARSVALLARAWRRMDAPVLYPAFQGRRGHPPLVSHRLFPAILRGTGEGGLRAILAGFEHQARTVEVLDQGVVLDLDTPADYAAALQEFGDRTVPTPAECAVLLSLVRAGEDVVRHGRVVAEVGARIAAGLARAGARLDLPLVRAAGLLHDLAKGAPDHARVGARRLARQGFARVARVVAAHTDLPPDELRRLSESAVLYLADKLVQGDRLVPLRERFHAAERKCGDSAAAREALAQRWRDANAIAARVEDVLGAGALERLAGELAASGATEQRGHGPGG